MKTIAICNHKGGVGKTALSMAIAEGLHRKGKRTLLVDLDQQMNATQQAKIDTTDEVTVYDLLTSFDYTAKDGIKHFDGGDIFCEYKYYVVIIVYACWYYRIVEGGINL